MDAQIFSQKFINCFEEVDETELLWEDDDSYYFLYDQLNSMVIKLSETQLKDRIKTISSEAGNLISKIENYKDDLKDYPELTDDQITRIIALNRIEFLFYQQIHKMQNDMNSIHFTIADKLIQGALVTGLNGPYHKWYLNELLNHERLVQVVDSFSKTRPILEKYGKQVFASQKIEISEMKTQEVFKLVNKVLHETPVEFLARLPEYREGLLRHVK